MMRLRRRERRGLALTLDMANSENQLWPSEVGVFRAREESGHFRLPRTDHRARHEPDR